MRQSKLLFLLVVLMSITSYKSYAYDIAVENNDGVTIYYNYINDSKELEVTTPSKYVKYSGVINIPEEVTYMNRSRKVTKIGEKAFYNHKELISVTIPNNVTIIGKKAFQDCESLVSISIGKSVTTIDEDAFLGCFNIQKVIVKDIAAWCNINFIPGYYNGVNTSNPLTCANHLYSDDNTEIENLVIPNNVTNIEQWAFSQCFEITSVTIPSSVTSIKNNAFYNCRKLKKVIVKDIAAWCNIEFEMNPLSIASHLYLDEDTEITDLVIPNSVTAINKGAFRGCDGITSLTFSNSVTSIGEMAFQSCSGLSSLSIGNNVNSVGERAFQNCESLTTITIPNSVTSIGSMAFYDSDIPTVISLIENPYNISSSIFSNNTLKNATLFVPKGTIDKYKTTEGWKDFLFIEEGTGPNGGGGESPDTKKCATPTINYQNGTLTFGCETEGATCQYAITNEDIKSGSGNEVQLGLTYHISVYATKDGYEDSDVATKEIIISDNTGDMNGDKKVDAADVVKLVNVIMTQQSQ